MEILADLEKKSCLSIMKEIFSTYFNMDGYREDYEKLMVVRKSLEFTPDGGFVDKKYGTFVEVKNETFVDGKGITLFTYIQDELANAQSLKELNEIVECKKKTKDWKTYQKEYQQTYRERTKEINKEMKYERQKRLNREYYQRQKAKKRDDMDTTTNTNIDTSDE